MNRRRRLLGSFLVSAGGAAASPWLAGCDRIAPDGGFRGIDITGSDAAEADRRAFTLSDPQGRTRTLADFRGKLAVVFFGYTQCPDVCPTTLAAIAQARQLLGADGARVVPVFVTVDPARDTAPVLAAYTAQFGPDVVGLRGTEAQLAAAAKAFKVYWSIVPGKTPTSYTVDHSAGSTVFDARGRLRLYLRHGMPPQDMAADFRRLLAERD